MRTRACYILLKGWIFTKFCSFWDLTAIDKAPSSQNNTKQILSGSWLQKDYQSVHGDWGTGCILAADAASLFTPNIFLGLSPCHIVVLLWWSWNPLMRSTIAPLLLCEKLETLPLRNGASTWLHLWFSGIDHAVVFWLVKSNYGTLFQTRNPNQSHLTQMLQEHQK